MDKFRYLLIIIGLLSVSYAYGFKLNLKRNSTPYCDLTEWVESQNFPPTYDNVTLYYPISIGIESKESDVNDTIAVIKGFIPIEGIDTDKIFLAGLVYVSSNFDKDQEEGFSNINYEDKSFNIVLKTTQGIASTETTYTRNICFRAKNGGIEFETTDIDCRYREKGVIPRTLRLEKLHPENNKRHEELVLELTKVNSKYLSDISEYISTRKDISAPNLSLLKKGSGVCDGMTQDEVLIILGTPRNSRKSGDKVRWIYDNEFIIIFTDGIVSKIIR